MKTHRNSKKEIKEALKHKFVSMIFDGQLIIVDKNSTDFFDDYINHNPLLLWNNDLEELKECLLESYLEYKVNDIVYFPGCSISYKEGHSVDAPTRMDAHKVLSISFEKEFDYLTLSVELKRPWDLPIESKKETTDFVSVYSEKQLTGQFEFVSKISDGTIVYDDNLDAYVKVDQLIN